MKKLIANILIATTLLSTSALYAAANPMGMSATNTAVAESMGRYLLSGTYRVRAGQVSWHKVPMRGGTNVYINLSGDGTTDLDMYVYDGNFTPIESSTAYGDDEAVDLEIYQSGYFWVKVVNCGSVYNDYAVTAVEY